MIVALVQNVALLIALVVTYQFIFRKWNPEGWWSAGLAGVLFGAVAIVSMMTPFVFMEGVVIDGRSIILSVAGCFGGPVAAGIAAVIAAFYRVSLGGVGVTVGVAVIFSSALIGVLFHFWRTRRPSLFRLWVFGFVVHAVMTLLLGFVPEIGLDLVKETGFYVLALFPVATVIVCRIFLDREQSYDTERKLYASEERNRTTLTSIGDGVISTDDQGQVVFLNPVAELLTGWAQAAAEGRPLEEVFCIISEATEEKVINPAEIVIRDGKTVGLANHTLLIARDGTRRPIADSAAPIRDAKGELTGVVLVFRDQTAEREAEHALEESERQLATLISNLPGMVYRCRNDQNWTVEFVNEACIALTGYTVKDFMDQSGVRMADLIHPEDISSVREETAAAIRERRHYSLRYRLLTSDGTLKHVEERGRAILNSGNEVQALEGFILNVTEREEAARTRERLEEELRHALKMEAIGRLAGGVAHDFNNMLAVINGYTELSLSETRANRTLQSYLGAVKQAGEKSAKLTRQLLTFARKQPIKPEILDLNDALSQRMVMLKRLISEEIRFVKKTGTGVGAIEIDPVQLDQVLINLIINARDAIASTGRVTISTEPFVFEGSDSPPPVEKMKPGRYATLSILDTGCGMKEDTLRNVFEPFFTTKDTGEGTGLGLATVHGILSQNNAFVDVKSSPGKGTEFRIYFPSVTEPDTNGQHDDSDQALPVRGVETILLVEDEASILNLGRLILVKLGYQVLAAEGPAQALKIAEEHDGEIDLLVTDVIMPEMNGYDLWQKLSEMRGPLRCLYVSGYTADIIHERGVLIEDMHFLAKPFTKDAVSKKIREALAAPPPEVASKTDSPKG